MIKVGYLEKNDTITKLEVEGHADFSKEGSDIVCSAVSSCVVGGLTNLSSEENFTIIVKKGYVLIESKTDVNEHDNIVLRTILVQLKCIEESYKKYITISKM